MIKDMLHLLINAVAINMVNIDDNRRLSEYFTKRNHRILFLYRYGRALVKRRRLLAFIEIRYAHGIMTWLFIKWHPH